MTTLDERYPDLLGHGDDPELARLVADLDNETLERELLRIARRVFEISL